MIGKHLITGSGAATPAPLRALLVKASAPDQDNSVLAVDAINSSRHREDLFTDISPKEMFETERPLRQRRVAMLRTFVKQERL